MVWRLVLSVSLIATLAACSSNEGRPSTVNKILNPGDQRDKGRNKDKNLEKVIGGSKCLLVDKVAADIEKSGDEAIAVFTFDQSLLALKGADFVREGDDRTHAKFFWENAQKPIVQSLLGEQILSSAAGPWLKNAVHDADCKTLTIGPAGARVTYQIKTAERAQILVHNATLDRWIHYVYDSAYGVQISIAEPTGGGEICGKALPAYSGVTYRIGRGAGADEAMINLPFAQVVQTQVDGLPSKWKTEIDEAADGKVLLPFNILSLVYQKIEASGPIACPAGDD
ncbi:MAG TPA: hypothetical protein PKC28_08635 [Bdellovibrionales bacterium]|nr:hypothetical protein [Bdellovibrionales bacterium]